MLLAAFAGGAFGASVGALPSFSLAGLVVIVGELYVLAARTPGADAVPVDVTGSIGFGVVLSPHVAFAGGVAAGDRADEPGFPVACPIPSGAASDRPPEVRRSHADTWTPEDDGPRIGF